MPKRHVVKLTEEERDALERICNQGRVAAQRRRHAGILRLVDEGDHGPALTDAEVAEQLEVTTRCSGPWFASDALMRDLNWLCSVKSEVENAPPGWTEKPNQGW